MIKSSEFTIDTDTLEVSFDLTFFSKRAFPSLAPAGSGFNLMVGGFLGDLDQAFEDPATELPPTLDFYLLEDEDSPEEIEYLGKQPPFTDPQDWPVLSDFYPDFIVVKRDWCGGCDLRIGVNTTLEVPAGPIVGPDEFFSVACYEVNKTTGDPVFNSWGVAAMGQLTSDGNRIYDGFFGTFKLVDDDTAPEDATDFDVLYKLDFSLDKSSLFFSEPFFNIQEG